MALVDHQYTFTHPEGPLRSLKKVQPARREEAMTKVLPLASSDSLIYSQPLMIGARLTRPKLPVEDDVFLSFDRHLEERFSMTEAGKELNRPPADWLVEFSAWIDSLRKP